MIEVEVCKARDMADAVSSTDLGQVFQIDGCVLYKGLYVVRNFKMPSACTNEFYEENKWRKKWIRQCGNKFGGNSDSDLVFIEGESKLGIDVNDDVSPVYIDEPVCLFQYHWDFNYHHFLISAMPRLAMLCQNGVGKIKILAKMDTPPYQLEFIREIFPDNEVVLVDPAKAYKIKTLYLMDFYADKADLIVKYYSRVKSLLDISSGGVYLERNIYVSRKDAAKKRPLRNELSVSEIMHNKGYSEKILSQYSVHEKAILFSNAHNISATFGAGVANIVFCSAGANLLFIEHPVYTFVEIYKRICEHKEIKVNIIKTRNLKWRLLIMWYKINNLIGIKKHEWSNDLYWEVNANLLVKEVEKND